MSTRKVTVYVPRVRDTTKHLFKGKAFRVRTHDNTAGQFGTRDWAEDAIKRAIANNADLVRVGVGTEKITVTEKADWRVWLTGNVVDPAKVPANIRKAYEDTLDRAAAAAEEYGKKVHVNSSWRSPAEQQALIDKYHNGGPLAAAQGKSPHQRGIGLDIPNARTTSKLIKLLRKHGLMDDVPSEIWHVTNHVMLAQGY